MGGLRGKCRWEMSNFVLQRAVCSMQCATQCTALSSADRHFGGLDNPLFVEL